MKNIFPLGRKLSDLIVTIYVLLTLFLRFIIEPQLQGNFIISVLLGGFALLFLWALVKSRILNPSYFGLMPTNNPENS
ncbi:MAG: hypothetical protein MRY78_03955 [Saprospiraceae bacterium]|nr:hypothetical protein [Saprospiraceae bacterium]